MHVRRPASGGKSRLSLGRVHPLDSENTDIPGMKTRDQMRDGTLTQVQRGEIKDHRPSDEKSRRARKRRVDLLKPPHDRNDRVEDESNVGPAPKAHQLTLRFHL